MYLTVMLLSAEQWTNVEILLVITRNVCPDVDVVKYFRHIFLPMVSELQDTHSWTRRSRPDIRSELAVDEQMIAVDNSSGGQVTERYVSARASRRHS